MTDSMRLAYACTSEEVAQAKSLLLRQQLGGGSKTRMWIVLLAIFCALICAFYVQILKDERLVWGGIFLVIWIVTFTLMKVRSKVTPPPVTIEIATGGLRVIDSKADVRVPWADFKRLIESETLFVLAGRDGMTALTIPKRAFPDEASRNGFKSVAETGMNLAPGIAEPGKPIIAPAKSRKDQAKGIVLQFRYGYLDFLDYALAGWFTRAAMLFFAGVVSYIVIHAKFHPVPHAVRSGWAVFLIMSPFFLVMICMAPIMFSVKYWAAARKQISDQTVVVHEEGLTLESSSGESELKWATFRFHKEGFRSFIIWNAPNSPAFMLPKRAIAPEVRQQLRELLGRQLKRSTWLIA